MITLDNVTFGYRSRKLFNDLNLEIESGSIYGLLGKNGEGKTTLMKLIAGLLTPKSGIIDVLGEKPSARRPSLLSEVFVLPEEFEMPRMSINEYATCYGVFYPNFSTTQLHKLLVELDVDANQNLYTMSFGQKKKAMIAFAIACNTKLLLMDEPTNGLDIPSKGHFRRVIASIAQDDRTIIISTHQVRDLDQLIDRILILDNSEILMNASVNEITEKLYFTLLTATDEALYAEQTIHGRWGVKINENQQDSQMDMELLFNAATSNRQVIKKIFNK